MHVRLVVIVLNRRVSDNDVCITEHLLQFEKNVNFFKSKIYSRLSRPFDIEILPLLLSVRQLSENIYFIYI